MATVTDHNYSLHRRPVVCIVIALLAASSVLLAAYPTSTNAGTVTGFADPAGAASFLRMLSIKKPPKAVPPVYSKPLPFAATGLNTTTCSGKTIMNIVAHEDDDLLFMNPAVEDAIHAGECVRTVYLTAGDDGRGVGYSRLREEGVEAAYDVMLGSTSEWAYRQVTFQARQTITVASPQNDAHVSLVFLQLPDGNLDGSGFADTSYESLAKLWKGDISDIDSLDGSARYTSAQLTALLCDLMEAYGPIQINTQANDSDQQIADHSDHITTGYYVAAAARAYGVYPGVKATNRTRYFMGYPIRGLHSNLREPAVSQKTAAFFAYAPYDTGVCTSMDACETSASTYGYYLSRQYRQPN